MDRSSPLIRSESGMSGLLHPLATNTFLRGPEVFFQPSLLGREDSGIIAMLCGIFNKIRSLDEVKLDPFAGGSSHLSQLPSELLTKVEHLVCNT